MKSEDCGRCSLAQRQKGPIACFPSGLHNFSFPFFHSRCVFLSGFAVPWVGPWCTRLPCLLPVFCSHTATTRSSPASESAVWGSDNILLAVPRVAVYSDVGRSSFAPCTLIQIDSLLCASVSLSVDRDGDINLTLKGWFIIA